MSITSEADWKGLLEIGRVVRLTLDALEQHTRAGVSTAELDQVAAQLFATQEARSDPTMVYGFPTVQTKDGNLSARYEHTVVITRDRPVLVTSA